MTMFFIRKWWLMTLDELLKTDKSKWVDGVDRAAQLKNPVSINIAPWTTEGAYHILVNGTGVAQVKSLGAAQRKARVIDGYLRTKRHDVILAV